MQPFQCLSYERIKKKQKKLHLSKMRCTFWNQSLKYTELRVETMIRRKPNASSGQSRAIPRVDGASGEIDYSALLLTQIWLKKRIEVKNLIKVGKSPSPRLRILSAPGAATPVTPLWAALGQSCIKTESWKICKWVT